MNKAIRITIIAVAVVSIAATGLYWYLQQTRTTYQAVVDWSNVDSAQLINTADDSQTDISGKTTIRLGYNTDTYRIEYDAADGYSDGDYRVEANQADIVINPDLSEDKLAERLQTEKPSIHEAIHVAYPTFDRVYKIKHEALYTDGSWYGAALDYVGDGVFNRDSVGIALHKEGGEWTIVTKPPLPSLNTYHDPVIPESLARGVNTKLGL